MNPIIILHAPDIHNDAKMLCQELDMMDFLAVTFGGITAHSSRSEVLSARNELFAEAPAIIILGSAQLFRDDFYLESAKLALRSKVAVFVLYDQSDLSYPCLFTDPIRLKENPGTDSGRAWNRLIQQLLRLTGPF